MPLWQRSRPRKRSRRPPRSAEAGPPTPRRSFWWYRGERASRPKRGIGLTHAPSPDVRSVTGAGFEVCLPFARLGIDRTTSPDVRVGHPWPPLSPRRLRFRPPGCACRRGRLPWYGQPLAEAVDDSRAADGPWMAYRHSTRRRRMRRQRRQKTLGVFCRRPRGKGHGWRIAIRRGVAGCDAHQAKKGHGWLFLRSSQCGRKVWRIVTWRTWRLVGS
jgi:hypothetical protein